MMAPSMALTTAFSLVVLMGPWMVEKTAAVKDDELAAMLAE